MRGYVDLARLGEPPDLYRLHQTSAPRSSARSAAPTTYGPTNPRGRPRDYRDAHPSTPLLVVEVAESSLAEDRLWKGGLYARAGVADYWILNLVDEILEVYRDPVRAAAHRHGWKYGDVRLLKRGAVASPLAAPRARVRVADLLP